MEIIARIYTDFKEKFGIPRQSGLAKTRGKIVFEPEYRNPDSLRGLEEYSHLWIIWKFSELKTDSWSPSVRPPRLGGNKKVGVFATRSPYRPNPIGLSSVKIDEIKNEKTGPVIYVSGADILDGTPIYDIKPYIAYTDSHPDAKSGFAEEKYGKRLNVHMNSALKDALGKDDLENLFSILEEDPRPQYQNDPARIYGMKFRDYEIHFSVDGTELYIKDVLKNV